MKQLYHVNYVLIYIKYTILIFYTLLTYLYTWDIYPLDQFGFLFTFYSTVLTTNTFLFLQHIFSFLNLVKTYVTIEN